MALTSGDVARRIWPNGGAADAWRRHGDYIRIKPHDPADLITKLAPVAFEPGAACPLFDRFLAEVQPEAAMRRFLLMAKIRLATVAGSLTSGLFGADVLNDIMRASGAA